MFFSNENLFVILFYFFYVVEIGVFRIRYENGGILVCLS